MLQNVSNDLKSKLPSELVDALLAAYEEIKQNFFLGKHEPLELNGGKFCEACFRIIQHETSGGNFTQLGVPVSDMIGKLRDFEKLPLNSTNESYRIHIPRVLISIYNIRNKRGVCHLGGDVNPNTVDASLIGSCADWVMAELFRIHYQTSLGDAQNVVNSIVQRRISLVYEIEDAKRVLLPSLSHREQTLVLLASAYPEKVAESNLVTWVEPANKSRYRNILRTLHTDRLIEYDKNEFCLILPTGLNYVEARYSEWITNLNNKEK